MVGCSLSKRCDIDWQRLLPHSYSPNGPDQRSGSHNRACYCNRATLLVLLFQQMPRRQQMVYPLPSHQLYLLALSPDCRW